jgi:DNA-binding NarL/FixJ family response regulator
VGEGLVIRVALADDQLLVRAGFRALLDAEDGIEVVAEARAGRSCWEDPPRAWTSC